MAKNLMLCTDDKTTGYVFNSMVWMALLATSWIAPREKEINVLAI